MTLADCRIANLGTRHPFWVYIASRGIALIFLFTWGNSGSAYNLADLVGDFLFGWNAVSYQIVKELATRLP